MKTLRFWALPVCQIAASYGAEAIFFYSLFDTKLHPDQDRIMEGGAADPFPVLLCDGCGGPGRIQFLAQDLEKGDRGGHPASGCADRGSHCVGGRLVPDIGGKMQMGYPREHPKEPY